MQTYRALINSIRLHLVCFGFVPQRLLVRRTGMCTHFVVVVAAAAAAAAVVRCVCGHSYVRC